MFIKKKNTIRLSKKDLNKTKGLTFSIRLIIAALIKECWHKIRRGPKKEFSYLNQ